MNNHLISIVNDIKKNPENMPDGSTQESHILL